MLNVSDGFREAVVGISRRMLARSVVEIIDPDVVYGDSNGSGAAVWSHPEQLRDRETASGPHYVTLEPGRWILDGTALLFPEDYATRGQQGHVGDVLSDSDGVFASDVYAEQPFSNVSILQACSIFFPTDPLDGYAVDLRVDVLSEDEVIYSREITGNTERSLSLLDFTVYTPTAIRVHVSRWSLPYRRMRVLDIVPGIYEEWGLSDIVSLEVQMRGNFAGLALPYCTAELRIRNANRRFEPFTRSGIFRSIEERQAIPISLGPAQEDGTVEFAPIGVFFQKSGGWTTGQNDMYIDWQLVDICGLLADRAFQAPDTLPTTLAGWFACFVAQLGDNFSGWYHVDPDYADLPLTIKSRDHLKNRTCGALIRFACMATGTWVRADQETGYLTAEPLWSQGGKVMLNQLYDYPIKSANDELATLTFKLYDGTSAGSTVVFSGNSTSSSRSVSIDNPFIHTAEVARTAARQILSQYGGIKLQAVSRGDPSSEIGDVDTIWISRSEAKTARRMEQSFKISNGVLKQNKNLWLQADGSFLFQSRVVLTEGTSWTAPAGVTQLRVILVGHGEDGTDGTDGTWTSDGSDGVDGLGALVWHDTININNAQTFALSFGADTVFGVYSSANGKRYPNGYTDVASGDSFARTGVKAPLAGSGDGGAKGIGGEQGNRHEETYRDYTVNGTLPGNSSGVYIEKTEIVIDNRPGKGTAGIAGASGCVVVYWDKEAEA